MDSNLLDKLFAYRLGMLVFRLTMFALTHLERISSEGDGAIGVPLWRCLADDMVDFPNLMYKGY